MFGGDRFDHPPMEVKNESGFPLTYATEGSVGLDLRACLGVDNDRYIQPGQRFKFDTGISIALPRGMVGFVQPRSGMGLHAGVVAQTGVIDRDYRGRIAVVLMNLGSEPHKVIRGDRIAQLVIVVAPAVHLIEVDALNETARGTSGFGSTGR